LFNIIKEKAWRRKATTQPFATKKAMADDSNEKETGSQGTQKVKRNKGSNRFFKRMPIGAATTKRKVCKETLQSLVTTFANMELKIKVIGSPE
jgi:hypothetical protein